MKYNPKEIKAALKWVTEQMQDINHKGPSHREWVAVNVQDFANDALAYIRHLEGELRRQGFTDYTEKEDTND